MPDRPPPPDHLDRWTIELRATGDTREEALRSLVRRAEAKAELLEQCGDEDQIEGVLSGSLQVVE